MDTSYILIRIHNKKTIELHYFICSLYYNSIIYSYPICFTANSSYVMFILLSLHKSFHFLTTEHKLYLGKELYKAEISIQLNQKYIQE
uniref:DUF4346 domain-containing protein n=1 Tax=Bostrychia simpliciuscula TaxID=324754 RepID=A0A1Z1M7I1_9FLOR|nr:hypothetical protein [Bostrychia simpliciuscula]ARW62048.1 hypothetical protein [Bostrychia simpliciuscula]